MSAVGDTVARSPRLAIGIFSLVLVLAAAAVILQAPTARADESGPDPCGYMWTDSNNPPPTIDFNWIEIKDNGTPIDTWENNGDDGYFNLPLGFDFPFYDIVYTDAFIGTNGYISFGQGYWEYFFEGIPHPSNPNNAIYGFGVDLTPQIDSIPQGAVYYRFLTAPNLTAPNRLVVEWDQVPHYPDIDPVTFEIILYEGGEIWFQYLTVVPPVDIVGVENPDGTVALSYDPGAVHDGMAIRISPSASPGVSLAPCIATIPAIDGDQADAPITVTNTGTVNDTVDLTYDSPSGWSGTFYAADGVTPLADTNGNGDSDTDVLLVGESIDVLLRVDVPGGATGVEPVTITGTAEIGGGSDTALAQFRIVGAVFSPPHFDFGSDSDADGLYDFLVMNISVSVTTPDVYYITAILHDPSNTLYLFNSTFVSLAAGDSRIYMLYSGWQINASGLDGPYAVDLYLYNSSFSLLDTDVHMTQAYSHLDFETPPAVLAPPHTDSGIDTDGDGRFNELVVDVQIDVFTAGTYVVYATLYDPSFSLILFSFYSDSLDPGMASFPLAFQGYQINGSGIDGPYTVDIALYASGPVYGFAGFNVSRTQAYSHLDFEEPPLIVSSLTTAAPTIDGAFSVMEWSGATLVDLTTIPGNALPAYMYVMNDFDNLYVAYDAFGDTTEGISDAASLAFDTGNDGNSTDGREDQFVQGGWVANNQAHLVWSASNFTWQIEDSPYDNGLPNHAGLTSDWGFGPSPNDGTNHRIYEFAIPLALLGLTLGDTIGFFAGSAPAPGVVDGDSFRYSTWPTYGYVPIPYYGDMATAGDMTPPAVSIQSPVDGFLSGMNSVGVTWTASDAGVGLDHFEVRVDTDMPVSLPSSATSYTAMGLSDGDHTVTVTAFDGSGNSASDSVTFRVDTTPPTVNILLPDAGASLASATVQVTWTATDATSGLANYEIRLDGGSAIGLPSTATSYTFSGLGDGPHSVELTAFDAAGHSTAVTRSFAVDTVSPVLAILTPSPGLVGSSSVDVTWTASDSGVGIDHFELSFDGGTAVALPASATSHTLTGLADGGHTIALTAFDQAGNFESQSVSFTIDTTAPSVTISSPAANAILGANTVQLTWSAFDATASVQRIEVVIDGGAPIFLGAGTSTYTASGLADGIHTFLVRALDFAGNAASASVSVTVDTTAPTVAIASPAPSAMLASSSIVVTWTSADATAGIDHFEVSVDGGSPSTQPASSTSYTISNLNDGSHTIRLTAVDRGGHSVDSTITVTVDTTDPSVSIVSPASGATITSSSVNVVWTAGDATSQVDYIDVSVDRGTPQTLSATATNLALSGLSDGEHTVTITVVDRAGNSVIRTVTFRVDTSFFSPSGPYGSLGIIGVSLIVIAAIIAAIVILRKRRPEEPSEKPAEPPPDDS